MEAAMKRRIQSGRQYDHLFPASMNKVKTVKENATLDDTIAFIHKVVGKTLSQTKQVAGTLSAPTVYATCRNIWHFVYNNVAYKKDDEGFEQIRSPARSWRDRQQGVDCDCYSTFISSILSNLGIQHKLRITKYRKDYFQHIYPIVPTTNGHITLDCVADKFDYEVPYSEKKDVNMDLQYLSGLHGDEEQSNDYVFSGDIGTLGLLGKKKRNQAANPVAPEDPNAVPGSGVKKKKGLKKLFGKINKINPATVLLRNGVLAAMKLNLFKVASRLRWSYISPNEATKRNILPDKYRKLVAVRQKLENIFDGAGGNIKNLRKAILKGKGNKDKVVTVSGLGFLPQDEAIRYMDIDTPLAQLLGFDIYHSENIEGMEGLGALGEPVTGATIAAAMAVLTAIAKLLKGVGNIFGNKSDQGAADFNEDAIAASEAEIANPTVAAATASNENSAAPAADSSAVMTVNSEPAQSYDTSGQLPATIASSMAEAGTDDDRTAPDSSRDSFWQKNKKWLLPAVIGVGGITIIALAMKMMKPAAGTVHGLDGAPRRNYHQRKKPYHPKKRRSRKGKKHLGKKAVALL